MKRSHLLLVILALFGIMACNLIQFEPKEEPLSTVTSIPTEIYTEMPEAPAFFMDGKIAFVSDMDGNDEIYIMNADGSNLIRLTDHFASDYDPDISPDGSKIVFVSERDAYMQIYVMDSDGKNLTRLTNHKNHDSSPVWSPDGTKIAFLSDREESDRIYIMDADGSNVTMLPDPDAYGWFLDWSPDGNQIIYTSYQGKMGDLSIVSIDGRGVRSLTASPDNNFNPAWSPDGNWIAYISGNRFTNSNLFIIKPTGSEAERIQVTNFDEGLINEPTWYQSEDESWLIFTSDIDGSTGIFAIDINGENLIRLTDSSFDATSASWGP